MNRFSEFNAVLGGQVGIGIFYIGQDKRRILEYVTELDIIYFGDRIHPLGNDYSIAIDPRIKMSIKVKNPSDTINKLSILLNKHHL